MGYEVWTTKETYICRETLRSKAELQDRIKECEDTIKDCQARLRRLAFMTEPKKFYKDDEDVMWQIDRELEEIFEEYDEARIKLTRLWQFEAAWDETHDVNGKAILPVDPRVLKTMSDKAYMGGDYCEYVLEDGSELPDDWWDVYHGFVKPENCSFAEKLGYEPRPVNAETVDSEIETLRNALIDAQQNPTIERDMTVGEVSAMVKHMTEDLWTEHGGIEVDLNEL